MGLFKWFKEGGPFHNGGDSPRWAFMEKFEIPDYDNVDDPFRNYLTRWRVVQTPWFALYLHKLDGPDPRPVLHDHPWPFISIVPRGGYWEYRAYEEDPVHIRWINVKKTTDFHYIDTLDRKPTWTVMLVGKRKREWGYVDPDGTWTVFYDHPNAEGFDAAMARRTEAKEALSRGDIL